MDNGLDNRETVVQATGNNKSLHCLCSTEMLISKPASEMPADIYIR